MKKLIGLGIVLLLCGSLLFAGGQSEAAGEMDYPTKAVKVIVPYSAGGGTDLAGRVLMKEMEEILGQPFNVENVSGASGTVGATIASNAPGDGYTIFFSPTDPMAAQPHQVDVPYTLDSFKTVAGFNSESSALAVQTSSPWKTLDDLLEVENTDRVLSQGHSGVGGINHICLEMFFGQTDIEVKDVPFDGGALAIAGLLGGHVDVIGGTAGAMVPYIESDEIRVLALAAEERSDMFPDVPTFKEKGFDIVVGVDWFLLVPGDTPDQIVEILEEASMKAAESDAFKKFVEERRQTLNIRNGEEMKRKLEKDYEMFGNMLE